MFRCLFSLICIVFVCVFLWFLFSFFPYCLFVSNSQVIGCEDCGNCIGRGVKLCSILNHYKQAVHKTVCVVSHSMAEYVMKVWAKANIPTRLKKTCGDWSWRYVQRMGKLWKNKENKAKHSESLVQKEQNWKEGLEELFDTAHADALELMTIQEDKLSYCSERKESPRPDGCYWYSTVQHCITQKTEWIIEAAGF